MSMFNKVNKKQQEEDQKRIEAFTADYKEVCKKHGIMFLLSKPTPQRLIMVPVEPEKVEEILTPRQK